MREERSEELRPMPLFLSQIAATRPIYWREKLFYYI